MDIYIQVHLLIKVYLEGIHIAYLRDILKHSLEIDIETITVMMFLTIKSIMFLYLVNDGNFN